ncbi:MAG TPA: Hsp70 family protein [Mycobacterium sp.]
MTRTTVDFGIDLGTTNSAIAVLRGVDTDIIKNNDDQDTTPSAVWIDKRDRLYVGKTARERSETDPDNTRLEFKLRMGTAGDAPVFPASGRALSPEELSAEVLKSLRADVQQRTGELIGAAVITVPAAFELNACAATERAAQLAGIGHVTLLQEPTAAALAYGFQSEDDAMWLVYDLGGGTFDAAVVQVRDGEFSVVNHRGDNFLGGKLIDWKIVEDLLIPAVAAEHGLTDLARGNPKTRGLVSKLKMAAEAAKIRLSRAASAGIAVELDDAHGKRVEFEYELRRADLDRIAEPFLLRSMNLCRAALQEAHLEAGNISRLILVGGPTLSPYLRERLADPATGLGIPLDHSQDPLTVVARGAAIFAGTQRIPDTVPPAPRRDRFALDLEYQPVGPDPEPMLAGRVLAPEGTDLTGYTLELANADARPPWRSGKITIAADGLFVTTLWAERGRSNTFTAALADPTGADQAVTPDRFTYTVGVVETRPPLTHSVGVGLAGNEVLWLVERGTPLPVTRQATLRTTVGVNAGQDQGMIRIPVFEGDHGRADRNRRVGRLEVHPTDIGRDVPEGSEVQFTVEIDASRLVVARAYLPLLNEEFEKVINLHTERIPRHEDLARDATAEFHRLTTIRDQPETSQSSLAELMLGRLEDEQIVQQVEELLDAARVDPDAANTCGKRILDLRAALDEIEDVLEWPQLEQHAAQLAAEATQIVQDHGDSTDRRALAAHQSAVAAALDTHDSDLLRQRVNEMEGLALQALDRGGALQVMRYDDLRGRLTDMADTARAEQLLADGKEAIDQQRFDRLRDINRQLIDLLPTPPPQPDPFSTVRGA